MQLGVGRRAREKPASCAVEFDVRGVEQVLHVWAGEGAIERVWLNEGSTDAVDLLDGGQVADVDFVWADTHDGPVALMKGVDVLHAVADEPVVFQNEAGPFCDCWAGDRGEGVVSPAAEGLEPGQYKERWLWLRWLTYEYHAQGGWKEEQEKRHELCCFLPFNSRSSTKRG